jgi:PAS domain S-box-containing protein
VLERELFAVLEGTADAAFTVDEEGFVRSWNRAATELFGYAATEATDKPCAALFQGRDGFGAPVCAEHCSVIECALNHRETPNYDVEMRTRSGEKRWVNVSILVFHNERTHRDLVVHLARDVSARKKRERLTARMVEVAKEMSALGEDPGPRAPVSPLTEQETRILRLLAAGKSPAQLCRELKITSRTLRNHIHHANRKLHTRSRLEAVMQAAQRNLI